jgi:hypothetical protein
MDDFVLEETIGNSKIFVSALSERVYRDSGVRGLGGSQGFFVCTERRDQPEAGFEVLAKAASADAAETIFLALVHSMRGVSGYAV